MRTNLLLIALFVAMMTVAVLTLIGFATVTGLSVSKTLACFAGYVAFNMVKGAVKAVRKDVEAQKSES